jgi:hypothetical protein
MKALLSVNITESQKGEFPDLGPISWGYFRLSQISLTSLRFHFLPRSGAITRRKFALFSGALLAFSGDHQ